MGQEAETSLPLLGQCPKFSRFIFILEAFLRYVVKERRRKNMKKTTKITSLAKPKLPFLSIAPNRSCHFISRYMMGFSLRNIGNTSRICMKLWDKKNIHRHQGQHCLGNKQLQKTTSISPNYRRQKALMEKIITFKFPQLIW